MKKTFRNQKHIVAAVAALVLTASIACTSQEKELIQPERAVAQKLVGLPFNPSNFTNEASVTRNAYNYSYSYANPSSDLKAFASRYGSDPEYASDGQMATTYKSSYISVYNGVLQRTAPNKAVLKLSGFQDSVCLTFTAYDSTTNAYSGSIVQGTSTVGQFTLRCSAYGGNLWSSGPAIPLALGGWGLSVAMLANDLVDMGLLSDDGFAAVARECIRAFNHSAASCHEYGGNPTFSHGGVCHDDCHFKCSRKDVKGS